MFTINPFGGMEEHNVYLCETDKTIIGAIKTYDLSFRIKWNNYSEAEFTFHRKYLDMLTGETKIHPLFDKVEQIRKILIEGVGYFVLQEADLVEDGIEEYKECVAFSEEYELAQRYLESFEINSGEIGSIDGVKFYDDTRLDKEHSLLDLVLEKYPTWSVGYVHPDLRNLERTYSIKREDVYDFLMGDVANTTKCVFIFNTFNNTVNAYPEDSAGEDTDIYVSLRNLAKEIEIKYNADDIKTVLNVTGADDLDIRAVNLGLPYIMDLSYYETPDWMGQDLFDAYTTYKQTLEENKTDYSQLLSSLYVEYDARDELYERVPDSLDSTDWTQYGLNLLLEKEAAHRILQTTQAEAGWGAKKNDNYTTYKENVDELKEIQQEIGKRKEQIGEVENHISNIEDSILEITSNCSMENNFTNEQLLNLSRFLREDEYNDKNFVAIESDTDSDILDLKKSLLDVGERELEKISRPQLEFDADINNLYAIPEFSVLKDDFTIGNYINVEIREGYVIKARILEIEVDTSDIGKLIVSFGNLVKLKDQSDIHAELLEQAASAGKNVASNSSYWQRGADKATETQERIAQGLIDAATSIKSPATAGQEVAWDNYGIHLRKYENGVLSGNEGWITNNQFLYSSDNFETVRSVFGEYEIDNETYWGLLAEAVIAGYIEGSTIVGGEIRSDNYDDGTEAGHNPAGSYINLEDGSFSLGGGTFSYNAADGSISGVVNEILENLDAQSLQGFISVDTTGGENPSSQLVLGVRDSTTGSLAGANIVLTNETVTLNGADNSTATLTSSEFSAGQAAFKNTKMGNWIWVSRTIDNNEDQNLTLKWNGN